MIQYGVAVTTVRILCLP